MNTNLNILIIDNAPQILAKLEEQIKLLEDILIIKDNINTCPHGRPFIMELTLDQLAKNFKRK